jgi:hypothetical protein
MIRTTHVARLVLIGGVAAALAASGAEAATKVHPDDRAYRANAVGTATSARVTPDNRAERAGPAGIRLAAPTPVTPDNRADRPSPPVTPVLIVPATAGGFSWADAGIGAAAMLGLGLAVVGIAVAFRRPNPKTFRA